MNQAGLTPLKKSGFRKEEAVFWRRTRGKRVRFLELRRKEARRLRFVREPLWGSEIKNRRDGISVYELWLGVQFIRRIINVLDKLYSS